MFIPWLNFASLLVSLIISFYLYILSVMPATRAEKYGPEAWEDCQRYRAIAGALFALFTMNLILWYWFPIPEVAWIIHPDPLVLITIGIAIAIPCVIVLTKGVIDAGKETMTPSSDTKMYGGIYNHIRHPQILGEMPLFVVITLVLNSLFLFIFVGITVMLVTPLMIYYEEKDLAKRFGTAYNKYKQQTGALFPKLRSRKKK